MNPAIGKISARAKLLNSDGKQRLAYCIAAALCIGDSPAHAQEAGNGSGALMEIVVTAQRRSQTTQDIPYNITAISGADLASAGAIGPNDLAKVVPGLVTIDSGPATRGGTNNLTLRGLRTDSPDGTDNTPQNVASVSTYFGDTPIFFPVVLKDIERIEVLRGPQGTLYGSGAEGGTIRIIPKRPDFTAISGGVDVGAGITEHASGKQNDNLNAFVNIPLADNLALRVVAGTEHLAGFINDVNILERTGRGPFAGVVSANPNSVTSAPVVGPTQYGTNVSNQDFFRSSLRWKPASNVDLQLDYLYQESKVADIQGSNPGYKGGIVDFGNGAPTPFKDSAYTVHGGGSYINTFPELQPYKNKVNLTSGTATIDVGLATFTSVTSYYENDTDSIGDTSFYYGSHDGVSPGLITYYGNYPRFMAITAQDNNERAFTQEVRLVSNWKKSWDYVIGGYYQDDVTNNIQNQVSPGFAAFTTANGTPSASPEVGDQVYFIGRRAHFFDRAIFGELTWHLTPKWQITGGARVFSQGFESEFTQESPFCGASCGDGISQPSHLGLALANSASHVRNHVSKINTSYDISDTFKVYATYSEGFRRGGANGIPIAGYFRSISKYETYSPDFAKTFEIGTKGSLVDHRLRFDADIFFINLDNFQFTTSTPSYESGVFNGNQAQSKGGEIELTADLTRRFKASFAYTYTLAQVSKISTFSDYPIYSILTGAPPSVFLTLAKGASLPGVPKHTLNAAADYSLPVAGAMSVVFHGNISYRSWALGAIDPNSPNYWRIPSITVLDSSVTLDSGKSWSASLTGSNLLNRLGYSAGIGPQVYNMPWYGRNVMRPRTYGLELRYRF